MTISFNDEPRPKSRTTTSASSVERKIRAALWFASAAAIILALFANVYYAVDRITQERAQFNYMSMKTAQEAEMKRTEQEIIRLTNPKALESKAASLGFHDPFRNEIIKIGSEKKKAESR